MDGVVDLVGREAAAAHRHAVSVEDVADRSPFDAEPVTELVHRRAGPIVGDQLLDLLGAELPSAAGAVALDRRRFGGIEAGELLAELFQGSDLGFYVRVRSPTSTKARSCERAIREESPSVTDRWLFVFVGAFWVVSPTRASNGSVGSVFSTLPSCPIHSLR